MIDREGLAAKLFQDISRIVEVKPLLSYLDVVNFLRSNCDQDTGVLVVGQFLVRALFEDRYDELLFWPLVALELAQVGSTQLAPSVVAQGKSYLDGAGTSVRH